VNDWAARAILAFIFLAALVTIPFLIWLASQPTTGGC
jgi:hypothetical protein